MSELLERLRQDFQDEDARYAYVEAHLNASVAAQIKTFRGEMSQQELAEAIGTKQSGISRLESPNYSSWKVETLRKLARGFGLRLRITFEEFGTLIPEIENFKKETLKRRKFLDDPAFKDQQREPKKIAAEVQFGLLAFLAGATTLDLERQGAHDWLQPRNDAMTLQCEQVAPRVTLQEMAGSPMDLPKEPLGGSTGIHLVVNNDARQQGASDLNPRPAKISATQGSDPYQLSKRA